MAAPAGPGQTSALLRPALSELQSKITELRISKWKAPGPVKEEAEQNVGSIDRDLQQTLPGLLDQADAAPRSVANAFAVYRNLDALYEVVLRVSGTADLAASDAESASLTHSLATLEASRRSLGESIVNTSHALEAAAQPPPRVAEAAAPVPVTKTTVVDDGAAPAHRKPKPKPKPSPPSPPS